MCAQETVISLSAIELMAEWSVLEMLYIMGYMKFSIKEDCILLMDNEKFYA